MPVALRSGGKFSFSLSHRCLPTLAIRQLPHDSREVRGGPLGAAGRSVDRGGFLYSIEACHYVPESGFLSTWFWRVVNRESRIANDLGLRGCPSATGCGGASKRDRVARAGTCSAHGTRPSCQFHCAGPRGWLAVFDTLAAPRLTARPGWAWLYGAIGNTARSKPCHPSQALLVVRHPGAPRWEVVRPFPKSRLTISGPS